MFQHNRCIDALRIGEAEQHRILGELEAGQRPAGGPEMRISTRYRYTVRGGVVLTVEGAYTSYLVRPRNLSSGGISFLHGGFVYPGCHSSVALTTRRGERVMATGHIVRCRCVRGRVHEVGMAFDHPVDVDDFLDTRTAIDLGPGDETMGESDYPRERVAELAQQIHQLALECATRALLRRKLAQLALLLTEPAPASGTTLPKR